MRRMLSMSKTLLVLIPVLFVLNACSLPDPGPEYPSLELIANSCAGNNFEFDDSKQGSYYVSRTEPNKLNCVILGSGIFDETKTAIVWGTSYEMIEINGLQIEPDPAGVRFTECLNSKGERAECSSWRPTS